MMRGVLRLLALVPLTVGALGVADQPANALRLAGEAFAKIADYSAVIVVHEVDGSRVEDRTYRVLFKKPLMERVDVIAGSGRGSGIVWLGGDTVRGHRGGFLSGIRLNLDLHNSQVTTLRGDSVDTATVASMIDDFSNIKGNITQSRGPLIDGQETVTLTLDVADPAADRGVTREVVNLSATTHLPVSRECFGGDTMLKSEKITEMKTDVGLTAHDFPW